MNAVFIDGNINKNAGFIMLKKIPCVILLLLFATGGFSQEENFVMDIQQSIDAVTIENQLPVFQKINAHYEGSYRKVPAGVQIALVEFINETLQGKGPSLIPQGPVRIHGSSSHKATVPLGTAVMLIDYRTTGAADAITSLCKTTTVSRSIRDRCLGIIRQHRDNDRLQEVGDFLFEQRDMADKQVSLLAYASMVRPPAEAIPHLFNEVTKPTLYVDENIMVLMARSGMSGEVVDLAIRIMKARPETADKLMPLVSGVAPEMLERYAEDFKEILSKSENERAKQFIEYTLYRRHR